MTTKAGDYKKIVLIFLAVAFFAGLFSTSVFAADPGHSAGVIAANDFESGNYSFPDSVAGGRS